jgi:hypothetical protein
MKFKKTYQGMSLATMLLLDFIFVIDEICCCPIWIATVASILILQSRFFFALWQHWHVPLSGIKQSKSKPKPKISFN